MFSFFSGNSVYGHSIMNKDKHTSVKFCGKHEASVLVNDPRFISLDEFEGECYEVNKIKINEALIRLKLMRH